MHIFMCTCMKISIHYLLANPHVFMQIFVHVVMQIYMHVSMCISLSISMQHLPAYLNVHLDTTSPYTLPCASPRSTTAYTCMYFLHISMCAVWKHEDMHGDAAWRHTLR